MRRALQHGLVVLTSLLSLGCESASRGWERAVESNSTAAYEEFAARHPDSEYADSARAAVAEMDWAVARDEDTIESYEQFLSKHAMGALALQADRRLRELRLQRAREINTVAGYREFLADHSDGYLTADAQTELNSLRESEGWEEAVAISSIERFRRHLEEFPDGVHAGEARAVVERLQHIAANTFVGTIDGFRIGRQRLSFGSDLNSTRFNVTSVDLLFQLAEHPDKRFVLRLSAAVRCGLMEAPDPSSFRLVSKGRRVTFFAAVRAEAGTRDEQERRQVTECTMAPQ